MNSDDNSNLSVSQIRDRALSKLIPLLDELDDPAEKKFDITMAALRATDSPNLLEKALIFAEQITDKSEQAQALIDVANEATIRAESATNA
jgi:hypothetical protein